MTPDQALKVQLFDERCDLLARLYSLTEENAQLKARIAELEKPDEQK